MRSSPSLRVRRKRGFTLTELVLVLGVASLIIGAIWVAVRMVSERSGINRVIEQSITVVQHVREYYGATTNRLPGPAGTDITATVDTARLIPVDMRATPGAAGGVIHHALASVAGGSFQLYAFDGTPPNPSIVQVRLRGLSGEQCIRLLMEFPVLTPELGAIQIGTLVSMIPIDAATNPAGRGAVTLQEAQDRCDMANIPVAPPPPPGVPVIPADPNPEVRIDFRLRN